MPTLITGGLQNDSLQVPAHLVESLKRQHGQRGRIEITRRMSRFGFIYAAWVVATIEENALVIIDHPSQEGKAQLEWWQQDHVLCGFASSASMPDAIDKAMASSRRGKLERLQLTVWRDRLLNTFRIYRRSPRGGEESNYQPTGEPVTRELFEQLAGG